MRDSSLASIDIAAFREREAQGLVTARVHPSEDLIIWNYTPYCQFARAWDEVTLQARGLITKADGTIVARPFRKFFNYEEYQGKLPLEPFKVTEKMDGCFLESTALNLWGGGTITIGEVVRNKLHPTLVGMDEKGNLVPSEVVDHFDNGIKNNWLAITLSNPVSRTSGSADYPNVLHVTDNHHIYINGQFQSALVARSGDEVITCTQQPAASVLHMIEASLLGDGSLSPAHHGWRYQESHKQEHHEYVEMVRKWLGPCAQAPGTTTSEYGVQMEWAQSRQYDIFSVLRLKWYPQGKKVVPEDLSWMDDFAVAKWYMDDGLLSHHEAQKDHALFATNGFTQHEVQRLADRLTEMYGVTCSVYEAEGWSLRLHAGRNGALHRFWEAIAPYIVPCLRYKLPQEYWSQCYRAYPDGEEQSVPTPAYVMDVQRIPIDQNDMHRASGRRGLDIKTTTGNYFAKGILVHNSLGILYFINNGMPQIATRGSFTSDQALRATKILHRRYKDFFPYLIATSHYTYLFEIVYPENRIVVDYGDMDDLILLAMIRTDTGVEHDIHDPAMITMWPFPIVKYYDGISDIAELKKREEANREGFVIRFENGLRLKVKLAEYVRLHRILTQVNARVIWERVRDQQPFDDLLERVPDEFYAWIASVRNGLLEQYKAIEDECKVLYEQVKSLPTRKEQAAIVMKHREAAAAVFRMLDGKDYQEIIWKQLRPQAERPFREDEA